MLPVALLPALLLTALIAVASVAQGQETRAAISDPAGDVGYEGTPGNMEALPIHEGLDITGAWIGDETDATLSFGIDTSAPASTIDSGSAVLTNPVNLALEFWFDGLPYTIDFGACGADEARLDPAGTTSGCLPAHRSESSWSVVVPKTAIVDRDDVPLREGSKLSGWFAWARDNINFVPLTAVDRGPDEGMGEPFFLALGDSSFGDFVVSTPQPIRPSNGGPDTMVFPVVVDNHGEAAQLLLSVDNQPLGWDIRIPSHLDLPAGDSAAFPVLLTTRSAHEHGSVETFEVRLHSPDGGSEGRVELGIEYLRVPQLAGHHPQLFVHAKTGPGSPASFLDGSEGWMNTLAADPAADRDTLHARFGGGANPGGLARWSISLDPALLIGMDFDSARNGTISTWIGDAVLANDAVLQAWLCHDAPKRADPATGSDRCDQYGHHGLLAVGLSSSTSMRPGGFHEFRLNLTPTAYADLVPYTKGSNIVLELLLNWETEVGEYTRPQIDTSRTEVVLPLNEYRDPIDEAFERVGSLRLVANGSYERPANPGQDVWFAYRVHNDGHEGQDLRLSAAGHGAELVDWRPSGGFRVHAAAFVDVAFRVAVPQEAVAGEFVEAFVMVESVDDPSIAALSKIRVVVTDEPVAQPSVPELGESSSRDTPAISGGYMAMLFLLGVAFGNHRRNDR